MAPVLSGVSWWGPEAGVLGSGAGAAAWLGGGGGELGVVGALTTLTGLVLLSLLLLLLCASCQGQKKTNGHAGVDNENLINGVSERETFTQSVDSPATDPATSTSQNGPLTSATDVWSCSPGPPPVLTDTQIDTSPQPSEEELLSSQTDLRSSKCPQDRELPRIPPNTGLAEAQAAGESTYEVVKEMAAASRDLSAEDSLYETVKELKGHAAGSAAGPAPAGSVRQFSLNNGSAHVAPNCPPPPVPNGRPSPGPGPGPGPSPGTPERGPLCSGVEYASVDLKKKSRHSANMEAKRSSGHSAGGGGGGGGGAGGGGGGTEGREPEGDGEPEEEDPPPLPEKVLDINDNQPLAMNGPTDAGLANGESYSSLSRSPSLENHIMADNESAVYSMVDKSNCVGGPETGEDREHDYTSIAEMNGMVPASSSSDLYATVRDIYAQPESPQRGAEGEEGDPAGAESTEPCYETIRTPKAVPDPEEGGPGLAASPGAMEGSDGVRVEPDYECLGEMGAETSRL
ncbi:phosphoprotein associated with glycosphingolipid-enriched microdomains 1 isoform X1 [Gadus chalcogrammus]|uniref:phosphoprotein associated with glycosphingolipid-enriched microdomains 1 isoform X1 n=1 Tax=Gadus chalcogrammus TaxID=1042646 RepID=UPI0024C48BFC|nr:phosphoprotein associated with glycosphingolipid-enriched microdomains 1 isoform X1 [Gadus chalcogrammus]XP_056439106.1 phosphoprotein associated with glycosphingolipid-enriched microdomains 1 isoform X1 [Gadus chalcogrammus]